MMRSIAYENWSNIDRFPADFMFRLNSEDGKSNLALRSLIATLKRSKNLKYAPYAFPEHGVIMAATDWL
jgi:hypothetical protein